MFITNLKMRIKANFITMVKSGIPADIARRVVGRVQELTICGVYYTDTGIHFTYTDSCGIAGSTKVMFEA